MVQNFEISELVMAKVEKVNIAGDESPHLSKQARISADVHTKSTPQFTETLGQPTHLIFKYGRFRTPPKYNQKIMVTFAN